MDQRYSKQQLENVLGEPFLEAFTENLLRIRRNLLLVSSLALVLVISDIKISGNGIFLGLNIQGITEQVIFNIIFWVTFYHLIHFIFETSDYTQRWRLRLTANRYASKSILNDHNEDYSYDSAQSTLYNWWKGMLWELNSSEANFKTLNLIYQDISDKVEALQKLDGAVQKEKLAYELKQTIPGFSQLIHSYQSYLNVSQKVISSGRITVSLERFDKWFWNYQNFQLTRLFVIEFLFPVVLGLISLTLTSPFPNFFKFEMVGVFILTILYFAYKNKVSAK